MRTKCLLQTCMIWTKKYWSKRQTDSPLNSMGRLPVLWVHDAEIMRCSCLLNVGLAGDLFWKVLKRSWHSRTRYDCVHGKLLEAWDGVGEVRCLLNMVAPNFPLCWFSVHYNILYFRLWKRVKTIRRVRNSCARPSWGDADFITFWFHDGGLNGYMGFVW